MANILLLLFHFASSLVKLARPGGTKALVAENLLLRQQLIVARRGLNRSPRLSLQIGLSLPCSYRQLVFAG